MIFSISLSSSWDRRVFYQSSIIPRIDHWNQNKIFFSGKKYLDFHQRERKMGKKVHFVRKKVAWTKR
jgi:hypothetical protein